MLFNSFHFACFFAILLPLYWALPHRLQNYLLLAASYYFYSCWIVPGNFPSSLPRLLANNHLFHFFWERRFLSLLVLSTVMDYGCGLAVDRIEDTAKRKLFVALSMALNLGMLGYFKYFNFFAESLHAALARAGLHVPLAHLNVVLPIGISFYTFQSMSYVIDVYRRDIKPTRNFIEFAAFVSFFPHLVAGPIMRPTTLLPQVAADATVRPPAVLPGVVPDLLGPDEEGRRRRQPGRRSSTTCSASGRRSTAAWRCSRSTPSRSRSTATSRATPTRPAGSPSAWASSWP